MWDEEKCNLNISIQHLDVCTVHFEQFIFQTNKCKNMFINNILYNVSNPTERTRLSISSKNSVIDVVNQSKYFIMMEVCLLNLLKLAHFLCAWAIHKRELPPSSDIQKQNNESAFSFVSNSTNQSIWQPYNAAPLYIPSLAQCAHTVRRQNDI